MPDSRRLRFPTNVDGPRAIAGPTDSSDDTRTICGRCRRVYPRHPSITLGDPPKWWVCPDCRHRLSGDIPAAP